MDPLSSSRVAAVRPEGSPFVSLVDQVAWLVSACCAELGVGAAQVGATVRGDRTTMDLCIPAAKRLVRELEPQLPGWSPDERRSDVGDH